MRSSYRLRQTIFAHFNLQPEISLRPVYLAALTLLSFVSIAPALAQSSSPQISAVSPTTARAGDQIVVNGSNFGSSQGSGNIWLGSTYGLVLSWSDTQVVASVASGSQSGVAQILQGGAWSNPVNFTVITPNIASIAPTIAIGGTQITIAGTGFGATQGSGNVWLGSTYGVVVSWSETQVVASIAPGSKSGVAQILQSGVWSNAVNLTVSTPNIANVTPTMAIAGTQVTITGTGFGANQGSGNVWLGSIYGAVVSWSDTQVVASVASGSKSGVAQVLQGGVWSNSVTFTVNTPNLTGVTPTTAIAGTQITITGTGFGANQGSGNVWLGSTYGVVVSWSDTQIVANVALGSKSGVAQVLQGGVWSNTVNLAVSTPNITSVTPTTAIAGTQITITGTGFGASPGTGNVWLGSTYGVVVSWSDTQILANVASGSKSGVAQVLQGGVWSNTVDLAVSTPNITSVTPTTAIAGTQITITGTGFGTTQGSGNVWLGSTYAVVATWSDTQIVATVASGSQTGVAQVLQGGVWSNTVTFAVTSLSLTSLTPASAPVGALVTITGAGFGPVQGGSTVNFNGTLAATTSWSDTRIVAAVSNLTTTGPVSVTVGGVVSNTLGFAVTATPSITDVSPNTATPGTQVTITGSGFGSAQGSGTARLGSTFASVSSWSDTSILATVAPGSVSGTAQVRQGGVGSNSVAFTVVTPTIASVSPTSGAVGAQVTITGLGFGNSQGSGQVSIGTAPAQVTNWSDTQVVATVASGSNSGTAQVLQNGVWSNSIAFTVTGAAPQIASINPNNGSAGTVVTIQGTGFGSSQGSGIVSIGATQASVNSWADTQVSVTVASTAVSGVAKVQQNGLWSNAVTFTVPFSSGGSQLTLNPNVISMLVGDTRSIQALGSNSQPVTGMTWVSSDTTIVTLSTDDPPSLTAVAPGNATILAGTASADVTVYAGSVLPLGAVAWSSPGDISGVQTIVPAVPSDSGVADVFALQNNCNVQALTSDGIVAWASSIGLKAEGGGCNGFLADFQGGLVASDPGRTVIMNINNVPTTVVTDGSVRKFDGITGQPYGAYTIAKPRTDNRGRPLSPAVHTDGTIFAIDGDSVVAIDPTTGNKKFSRQMEHSTCQASSAYDILPSINSNLMIAGDGYAYLLYSYTLGSGGQTCQPDCIIEACAPDSGHIEWHGRLLRLGTGGDSSEIVLGDASEDWTVTSTQFGYIATQAGQIPQYDGTQILITNADQGVLLSLYAPTTSYCAFVQLLGFDGNGFPIYNNSGCVDGTFNTQLVSTSGVSVASKVTLPDDITYVEPDLQAQDGTYFGIVDYSNDPNDYLAKFDAAGNIQWSVPNFYAQMATADGGLIAQSGDGSSNVTFDANGSATGQLISFPTLSWRGRSYQEGSVEQIALSPPIAAGLWPFLGGNPSGTGPGRPWYFALVWGNNFTFYPGYPNPLPSLTIDITSQASGIKHTALKAFRAAYNAFPVTVFEGVANAPADAYAIVMNHSSPNNPDGGDTPNIPNQGIYPPTAFTNDVSLVDYINNMVEAQSAIALVINNAQDESAALSNQALFQAIGTGIGNSAAHEVAHQFLLSCCDMDSNPLQPSNFNPISSEPDLNARGTWNDGAFDGKNDPALFIGYWPDPKIPMHWENTPNPDGSVSALTGLETCLATGWYITSAHCWIP